MGNAEVKELLGMSYKELVDYLLSKYGPAKCDYFCNENCKTKNAGVSRTSEGLVCHHIDEDKAIMLSTPEYAIDSPFAYQKADRLVYCNILEHLILHIKIAEEPRHKDAKGFQMPGIGGAINNICPQINDYYNGYKYKKRYQQDLFAKIKDNFDDYIEVLQYFLDEAEYNPNLALIVTKERLSMGWNRQIIAKIYNKLQD